MKRITILTVLSCLLAIVFSGCYYDKEELVYPRNNNCDTTNLTHTSSIEAIINDRCYSCHSGTTPLAGLNLQDYDQLKLMSAHVVDRITRSPSDPQLMPNGGPKLPDCEIAKIKAWVAKGAPK